MMTTTTDPLASVKQCALRMLLRRQILALCWVSLVFCLAVMIGLICEGWPSLVWAVVAIVAAVESLLAVRAIRQTWVGIMDLEELVP